MSAHWRLSDPMTSKLAAMSIAPESITDCKRIILEYLQTPHTDEQLVERWGIPMSRMVAHQSPSSIRSRRAELTDLGLVQAVGYGKTRSGRKAILWQVADVQN